MAYRLSAVPGLLALAAVGVAVARPGPRGRASAPGRCSCSPPPAAGSPTRRSSTATRRTCSPPPRAVGAILAARGGRTWARPCCSSLAVVAKQWAVLAILPAAMAAPRHGVRGSPRPASSAPPVLLGLQMHPVGVGLPHADHQHGRAVPPAPALLAVRDPGHARVHRGRATARRWGPAWLSPLTRPLIIGAGVARRARLVAAQRPGPQSRRRARSCSRSRSCCAACSTRGTSSTTTCRSSSRSPPGRRAAAATCRCCRVVVTAAVLADVHHVYDAREGYGPYLAYLGVDDPAGRRPRRGAAGTRAAAPSAGSSRAPGSRLRLTGQLPCRGECPAAPTSAAPPSSPSTSTS